MMGTMDEFEFEGPAVSRLETPLTMNDIMSKCPEFSITTEEDIDREEELSMSQVYDYDKLEPFTLYDNLEVDSENEDDNPSKSFPVYRKQMCCVTDDAKIMKKLERDGLGEIVGDRVKVVVYVHYAAYTELNEIPFDVSRLRHKKPLPLRLGIDSVVVGLETAIRTMKKGEKSKFLVHPDHAFGVKGVPPRIPPNSTILYDVELIDFSENEALNVRFENEEDKLPKTFEETLKLAKQLHSHGNKLKKHEKNLNAAIASYRKALFLLLNFHYKNGAEETESKGEMVKLYTNLAICYMQKKNYKKVCIMYNDACHDCQNLARNSPKLLYNSAKALKNLGDYREAAVRMKRALKLKPEDTDIIRELKELNNEKVYHEKTERNICKKMFGFYKNNPNADDEKLIEELIDQVNDEFKELFLGQIESFVDSEKDSITLSYGATQTERDFCQGVCKKNFLSFRETKIDGLPHFIITKKT